MDSGPRRRDTGRVQATRPERGRGRVISGLALQVQVDAADAVMQQRAGLAPHPVLRRRVSRSRSRLNDPVWRLRKRPAPAGKREIG